MVRDLSTVHHPITDLFPWPRNAREWNAIRLNEDQVEFYREHGYVAGIRMLEPRQVEALRKELDELLDSTHPGRSLFYEYNSNESSDPSTVLFHALGAWRVKPAFHDIVWNPKFLEPASQLLKAKKWCKLRESTTASFKLELGNARHGTFSALAKLFRQAR